MRWEVERLNGVLTGNKKGGRPVFIVDGSKLECADLPALSPPLKSVPAKAVTGHRTPNMVNTAKTRNTHNSPILRQAVVPHTSSAVYDYASDYS